MIVRASGSEYCMYLFTNSRIFYHKSPNVCLSGRASEEPHTIFVLSPKVVVLAHQCAKQSHADYFSSPLLDYCSSEMKFQCVSSIKVYFKIHLFNLRLNFELFSKLCRRKDSTVASAHHFFFGNIQR